MQEPLLSGMNLTYQTLEPLHDAKNHQLFVGTITLMLPQELPLDFNVTMGNCLPQPDGTCLLEVKIRELEPDIFLETYQALGLLPAAFTHHFFSSHRDSITIAEIFTELCHGKTRQSVPLTLKNIHFLFSDGSTLDFSSRIGVFALWQLAETA